MNKIIKVYISNPETDNKILDMSETIKVANELLELGFSPYIPYHQNQLFPIDEKSSIKYNLNWLECCDCVYITNTNESEIVDQEIERAESLAIPVFRIKENLIKFKEEK